MEEKNLGKCSSGMQPNLAALLSYLLGFITGILFYFFLEKENKFVRFHAMQSIVVSAAFFVAQIILGMIPILGWVLSFLVGIGGFILWIFLMIKAYKGEYYKLPYAGDIAEKNS